MKRRSAGVNVDGTKWRRPIKRNNQSQKMSDNLYGGSVVYIKLLLLWALVLLSDYFLEFRFEYLWPFWLFLRSVYDSFKYQGLAFSVFFICIAITSDMICFLFIPVHWLFFAASTYVWVQYVWHTEKGVCLPTIVLWLLFVYIEAAIRLKEFKAHVDLRNLPFHLDLCRPFAAHCIGYPVVTLGFGFKSYLGYRMRQRRQKEVQRENEYYYEFLREALPPGQVREEAFNPHPSPQPCSDDKQSESNGVLISANSNSVTSSSSIWQSGSSPSEKRENGEISHNLSLGSSTGDSTSKSSTKLGQKMSNGVTNGGGEHLEYLEKSDLNNHSSVLEENSNGGGKKVGKSGANNNHFNNTSGSSRDNAKQKNAKFSKEDMVSKLEGDVKRIKTELQQSRNKENDLRDQIISYMSSERHLKSEISNLQVEKSVLESRLSGLLSTRASEKATLSTLEKKLTDERKQKTEFQIKLETERKLKKDAANAERTNRENQTRGEVLKLEAEIKTLRSELQTSRERCQAAEQEVYALRKYKETHGDPEVLVKALKNMQEKNNQIEKSLSAETKLKMDLFSALGETKRELVIKQAILVKKDSEIKELRAKIAEVLAVMPHSAATAAASATQQHHQQPQVSAGISSFAPTTLALDLPPATDLSYNGKLSALGTGLSDFEIGGQDHAASNDNTNIYSFNNTGTFSPHNKTNGKVNSDV